MNLNAANLKVGLAASTDKTKANLNSIHITSRYTEATNGHILARVSLPEQYDDDVPTCCPTSDARDIVPVVVPAKPVMGIKIPKDKRPTLNAVYIDVEKTNTGKMVVFGTTDRKSTLTPTVDKIDDLYSETDRVLPSESAIDDMPFRTCLNIDYLKTLLEIAKSTGAEIVYLYGGDHTNKKPMQMPVILKSKNEKTMQTFTGIIMPFNA